MNLLGRVADAAFMLALSWKQMHFSSLIVKVCCDITTAQLHPGSTALPLTRLLELDTM